MLTRLVYTRRKALETRSSFSRRNAKSEISHDHLFYIDIPQLFSLHDLLDNYAEDRSMVFILDKEKERKAFSWYLFRSTVGLDFVIPQERSLPKTL